MPMRSRFPSISLILFFIPFLVGCAGEEDQEKGKTIVSGSLQGKENDKVRIKDRVGLYTYEDTVIAEAIVGNEGSFELSFDREKEGYLTLDLPLESVLIYLKPGDSLYVLEKKDGTLQFSGKGSKENRYLAKRRGVLDSLTKAQGPVMKMDTVQFLDYWKDRGQTLNSLYRSYFKEHSGCSSSFKKLEAKRVQLDLAVRKFTFPNIYRYEHNNDTIEFGREHWGFLDSLSLNDTVALKTPEFLHFAYDLANKYALDNKGNQKNMNYREMLFRTIEEEFDGKVEDAVLTYFMLEQMNYGVERVEGILMERYTKEVRNKEMVDFVKSELRKKKKAKEPI